MRGTYRLKLLWRSLQMSLLRAAATRSVQQFPKITVRKPHGLAAPLIVTLTSYPPRFGELALTLRSLLDQTVAADRVVLWIAHSDMPQLPRDVLELTEHGLEIRPCRDRRSYKKLIPALEAWPEACFVTADDDVWYAPEWLESLVSESRLHPQRIIGGRVHLAKLRTDGRFAPYADWELATEKRVAEGDQTLLFPTGVGGILYPPRAFAPEVFDEASFMEMCPQGDDIWFFWMARMAGTGHRRARDRFEVIEWPNGREVALYKENLLSDGNDQQIRAMERRFGSINDLSPGRAKVTEGHC